MIFRGHIDQVSGDRWITATDNLGEEAKLNLRLDLRNHSTSGFSWGFMGSGCSQSALAVLAYYMGDERALYNYMFFKWRYMATIDMDKEWTISSDDIDLMLKEFLTETVSEYQATAMKH